MIKRITSPEEFKQVAADIFSLHKEDSENYGHHFLRHDQDSIIANLAHVQTLAWHVYIWANFNGTIWDAIICFSNERSVMFGTRMFTEHIWLSKNPKVGYKLLKTALTFAKKEEFDVVAISCVEKNPSSKKLKKLYKKLGFKKDSETYLAKIK